jgi:hypothetical protein
MKKTKGRPPKHPDHLRIQLKPSPETVAALLVIALHTNYQGNTAIIEAAVQRWAKELENTDNFKELVGV